MNFLSNNRSSAQKKNHSLYKSLELYVVGLFSALIVALLFFIFRRLSPFIFQTNDDLFLKQLASGEMCGVPQSHLFHISYPVGLLLSVLYRMFPALPWYGLLLCFTIGLFMTIVLSNLLLIEKSLLVRLLTIILFCFFSYGFLFLHIVQLQFTTVAAMAGCSALFLFMLASPCDSIQETVKNYISFLLLSACAFCIRSQVLFMFLPFIGMIGLGKWLDTKSPKQRKSLLALAGIFTVMLASLFLIEKLAYQEEQWTTFSTYSKARAEIYDYDGFPDYDTHKETYELLNISRSSYEAASQHYCIMLDSAINDRSFEALRKINKQENSFAPAKLPGMLLETASAFIQRHTSYVDRPLNLLVYCCYILFFLGSLLCQKRNALRDILFLGGSRMVIWTYLLFNGRLPSRVSQSIYLAELIILLAVAFKYRIWSPHDISRKRPCSGFWIISFAFLSFICLRFGFPKANAAAWEAASRCQFSQSFADIKDYFHAHPENVYYIDIASFEYFTEDALQRPASEYDNFFYMGSWISNSPWYDKKFERAGISDPAPALYKDPSVFVVFMNIENISYDYLEAFYAENHPGVSLHVMEMVDVSNGLQFLICKFF